MPQVNVTDFRRHLFDYLSTIEREPIDLTLHGKIIAKVSPVDSIQAQARARLLNTRKSAKIVDLDAPFDLDWTADEKNSA